MILSFDKITLENFKSYKGTHTLDLAALGAGLHYITGKNIAEPALQANGAGKSTLLDGLCWVLYGKTHRGLRASNIHTWGVPGHTKVQLNSTRGGVPCIITRSWTPNGLWLDGHKVEQEVIDTAIGMSFNTFCNALVIGQFSTMFFDMQPAARLTLLSDVLMLDRWDRLSANAKSATDKLEKDRLVQATRLEMLWSKFTDLRERTTILRSQRSHYERTREERINEIIKGININEINKVAADYDLFEELRHKTTLGDNIGELTTKDTMYTPLIQEHTDSMSTAKASIISINHAISNYKTDIQRLRNVDRVCPHCNQPVSQQHIDEQISNLIKLLKTKKTELKTAQEVKNNIENKQLQIQNERNAIAKKIEESRKVVDAAANNVLRLQRQVDHLSDEHKQLKRDLQDARSAVNPYKRMLTGMRRDKNKAKADRDHMKEQLKETEKYIISTTNWRKGFKEIRLSVVAQALTIMTNYINSNLMQLGLTDWAIQLDVERETAGGNVAKGFHVTIHSPYNNGPVPWEAWSGGETQRLRLAGTLGLSDLIMDMSGVQCDFLALDEPTQHLTTGGITSMLDLLWQRTRDDNRQILVVDHMSTTYGGFASELTVQKDKDGWSSLNMDNGA